MFERSMSKVKGYLDEINASYHVVDLNGFEQIYVMDKNTYEKVKNNPIKYKDVYVPYLRISDHDGEHLYTRHNGITGEMSDNRIKKIVDELTFGEKG